MKTIYALLTLVMLAHGQVIVSKDGQSAQLPAQFVVSPEGIQGFVKGQAEPKTIPWERIDLNILARTQPEIEKARQEAVLKGEKIYFTLQPPPNYYREFLKAPVNVEFNRSWDIKTVNRGQYIYSTDGYADIMPKETGAEVSYSETGFISGKTETETEIVDTTRYPLATDMGGLLLILSSGSKESKDLLRDLKEQGGVLANLLIGLRQLARAYPQDREIQKAYYSVEKLRTRSAVSVDAMRQLRVFLEHAKRQ